MEPSIVLCSFSVLADLVIPLPAQLSLLPPQDGQGDCPVIIQRPSKT
jgi:hypothetical protein